MNTHYNEHPENDGDDDGEETESSSEVDWNEYFTGHEQAVIHEDFELGRSFFDIVKDELPSELYSKFIEFCKSINKSITISYDTTSHIIIPRSNWTVSHISDLYEVFSPLRRDLKKLMENGLAVQRNGVEIKLGVCLAFVLGDNLGVCELLVMSRNFSKGFMCRYCGLTIFISMLFWLFSALAVFCLGCFLPWLFSALDIFNLAILTRNPFKDWNRAWKTAIKGRTTAAFFPSIEDRRNCHFLPNYVQTQFLTGHGRFAAYLERRKIHSSDRCICGERQTAEHVLLHCPATFNSRALVEARIGSLKSLEMNKKNFHLRTMWNKNHGKCGICGDSYSLKQPRPYESGGIYVNNIIVQHYRSGSTIAVIIFISANHKGKFSFSICPRNDPHKLETEECFIPLMVNGEKYYRLESNIFGNISLSVQLPSNVECKHCVLRWHWRGGNNWGICPDGKGKIGCGPQETFRNCADISVGNIFDDNHEQSNDTTTTTMENEDENVDNIIDNEILDEIDESDLVIKNSNINHIETSNENSIDDDSDIRKIPKRYHVNVGIFI
ncbi:hypothetical protein DERF_011223 [Dermatophagoides farinae]|uniref:Chitin-binding type-4 domain-containing protein n=1 Tax=Dermatophagoides farinae TaxID=6954 RepID=A0A922HU58_DERFA|nr:hypothetical protein DERF_011223 [Dermatophagoides farinae]